MGRHDISDEKWAIIEALLPHEVKDPRGRKPKEDRKMFNAILWILKTGAPWRDLPKEFGPWQTVYKRHARWAKTAIWDDILSKLSEGADSESVLIDASYAKLHQHGSGAKGGTLSNK